MSFEPHDCECPKCGSTYYKTESWKRVCLDCYIDKKRAEEGLPPKDRTKSKAKYGNQSGFNSDDFFNQFKRPPPPPSGSGLDKEMVRRLLQLCHPDKHNGSVASTKATQWLLGLKL